MRFFTLIGSRMQSGVLAVALVCGAVSREAAGQLAITEAMSSASTSLGMQGLTRNSDFWELTNFGTNDIDLTGYRWNDRDGGWIGADSVPFAGLTIAADESIIFVQNDVTTTPEQFRDWWGPGLPANLRGIFFYGGNGLSANEAGDSILLWGPNGETDLIDRVDFPQAARGRSFTYNPQTGLFDGVLSAEGVNGAFRAVTRDDIGSPGTNSGPVKLHFLMPPTNLSVCAGIDATFSVKAGGLPRPRYQWFFKDTAVPGATSNKFTITNPQSANAGPYQVEVSNGFTALRSEAVSLEVSSEEASPTFSSPLADVSTLIGETARFSALVCAVPPPVFQWWSNGVPIEGATSRTLVVLNCQLEMSGTIYCLQVQNLRGSNSVCARLTVMARPHLEFTEVMAAPSTNCTNQGAHADWFEVTNLGTNEVNLLGYRFANDAADFETTTHVVRQPAIIQPGHSAIFAWTTTESFVRWWGADALPPGLPIITFSGQSLMAGGEPLYLWNPSANEPLSPIAYASYASDPIDGLGLSQYFNVDGFADSDTYSLPGERGAFRAAECGDIGSPGYLENPPPRVVSLSWSNAVSTLRWRAIPDRTYSIKWKRQLTDAVWTTLLTRPAVDWVETATDSTAGNAGQRFYLLEEVP